TPWPPGTSGGRPGPTALARGWSRGRAGAVRALAEPRYRRFHRRHKGGASARARSSGATAAAFARMEPDEGEWPWENPRVRSFEAAIRPAQRGFRADCRTLSRSLTPPDVNQGRRAGYEGMKQRADTIPPQGKPRLTEALERLARLYDAWGKP